MELFLKLIENSRKGTLKEEGGGQPELYLFFSIFGKSGASFTRGQ